ncbi:hypothetical protein K8S19_13615, partial [bacterium]|nr:hypothetical protein [bacterium]
DISELEKPDLTDRGMIGRVPMPPNCYWDADTQAWVEIGEGKAEGGDGKGAKAGNAEGDPAAKADEQDENGEGIDGGEKQGFWNKVKNVYNNTRPAGLAKNTALAAAPDGAKKASDTLKQKAKDTAKKTSELAKKAGKATKNAGKAVKDVANRTMRQAREYYSSENKVKYSYKYFKNKGLEKMHKIKKEYGDTGTIDGTKYGLSVGYFGNIKLGALGHAKLGMKNSDVNIVEDGEIVPETKEYYGGEIEILGAGLKIAKESGEWEYDIYWNKKGVEVNKNAIEFGGTFQFPLTPIGITGEAHIHPQKIIKKILKPFRRNKNEENNPKNYDTKSDSWLYDFSIVAYFSFGQFEKHYTY